MNEYDYYCKFYKKHNKLPTELKLAKFILRI